MASDLVQEIIQDQAKGLLTGLRGTYPDLPSWREVLRHVQQLSRSDVDALAARAIWEDLLDRERSRTRGVERKSSRAPRKGTKERERWEQETEEGKRFAEIEERANRRLHERLTSVIEDFREALRVEWTEELLSQSIAMRDGTRTTWGEATVDQHRERMSMFIDNAQATMEGAARHQQAIDDIQAAGVHTLAQLRMAA